jgi:hypothetical protein
MRIMPFRVEIVLRAGEKAIEPDHCGPLCPAPWPRLDTRGHALTCRAEAGLTPGPRAPGCAPVGTPPGRAPGSE